MCSRQLAIDEWKTEGHNYLLELLKMKPGPMLTGMLIVGLLLALTACAVPEWLLAPAESSDAEPQEAYPAIATVAATGTPIDAVGEGAAAATITLPSSAGENSTGTAEPVQETPAAEGELCVDSVSGQRMSYEQAVAIASASDCTSEGDLLPDHFCNENTGTWWIGLDVEREGCYPACTVDVTEGTAAINWRCTGALVPATATADTTPAPELTATVDGAAAFRNWQGMIYRQPSGSLVEYRFQRDDGQWFDIEARDSEMRRRFADAAWTAVQVVLSGEETAVGGVLDVRRLVELPLTSNQPRNLTPFAMPETSSRLAVDEGGAYYAWSAIDGSLTDPWCEGAQGPGSGEWLQLDFSAPLEITEIRLANGYQDGDYLYVLNNRVKTMSIYIDGERMAEWELDDNGDWQSYTIAGDVAPGITADNVRLVIEDAIEGWAYEDTCIAEVEVWGRPRE
jgi:hypothetical protein